MTSSLPKRCPEGVVLDQGTLGLKADKTTPLSWRCLNCSYKGEKILIRTMEKNEECLLVEVYCPLCFYECEIDWDN